MITTTAEYEDGTLPAGGTVTFETEQVPYLQVLTLAQAYFGADEGVVKVRELKTTAADLVRKSGSYAVNVVVGLGDAIVIPKRGRLKFELSDSAATERTVSVRYSLTRLLL